MGNYDLVVETYVEGPGIQATLRRRLGTKFMRLPDKWDKWVSRFKNQKNQ